jgi:hypothetical protein
MRNTGNRRSLDEKFDGAGYHEVPYEDNVGFRERIA